MGADARGAEAAASGAEADEAGGLRMRARPEGGIRTR